MNSETFLWLLRDVAKGRQFSCKEMQSFASSLASFSSNDLHLPVAIGAFLDELEKRKQEGVETPAMISDALLTVYKTISEPVVLSSDVEQCVSSSWGATILQLEGLRARLRKALNLRRLDSEGVIRLRGMELLSPGPLYQDLILSEKKSSVGEFLSCTIASKASRGLLKGGGNLNSLQLVSISQLSSFSNSRLMNPLIALNSSPLYEVDPACLIFGIVPEADMSRVSEYELSLGDLEAVTSEAANRSLLVDCRMATFKKNPFACLEWIERHRVVKEEQESCDKFHSFLRTLAVAAFVLPVPKNFPALLTRGLIILLLRFGVLVSTRCSREDAAGLNSLFGIAFSPSVNDWTSPSGADSNDEVLSKIFSATLNAATRFFIWAREKWRLQVKTLLRQDAKAELIAFLAAVTLLPKKGLTLSQWLRTDKFIPFDFPTNEEATLQKTEPILSHLEILLDGQTHKWDSKHQNSAMFVAKFFMGQADSDLPFTHHRWRALRLLLSLKNPSALVKAFLNAMFHPDRERSGLAYQIFHRRELLTFSQVNETALRLILAELKSLITDLTSPAEIVIVASHFVSQICQRCRREKWTLKRETWMILKEIELGIIPLLSERGLVGGRKVFKVSLLVDSLSESLLELRSCLPYDLKASKTSFDVFLWWEETLEEALLASIEQFLIPNIHMPHALMITNSLLASLKEMQRIEHSDYINEISEVLECHATSDTLWLEKESIYKEIGLGDAYKLLGQIISDIVQVSSECDGILFRSLEIALTLLPGLSLRILPHILRVFILADATTDQMVWRVASRFEEILDFDLQDAQKKSTFIPEALRLLKIVVLETIEAFHRWHRQWASAVSLTGPTKRKATDQGDTVLRKQSLFLGKMDQIKLIKTCVQSDAIFRAFMLTEIFLTYRVTSGQENLPGDEGAAFFASRNSTIGKLGQAGFISPMAVPMIDLQIPSSVLLEINLTLETNSQPIEMSDENYEEEWLADLSKYLKSESCKQASAIDFSELPIRHSVLTDLNLDDASHSCWQNLQNCVNSLGHTEKSDNEVLQDLRRDRRRLYIFLSGAARDSAERVTPLLAALEEIKFIEKVLSSDDVAPSAAAERSPRPSLLQPTPRSRFADEISPEQKLDFLTLIELANISTRSALTLPREKTRLKINLNLLRRRQRRISLIWLAAHLHRADVIELRDLTRPVVSLLHSSCKSDRKFSGGPLWNLQTFALDCLYVLNRAQPQVSGSPRQDDFVRDAESHDLQSAVSECVTALHVLKTLPDSSEDTVSDLLTLRDCVAQSPNMAALRFEVATRYFNVFQQYVQVSDQKPSDADATEPRDDQQSLSEFVAPLLARPSFSLKSLALATCTELLTSACLSAENAQTSLLRLLSLLCQVFVDDQPNVPCLSSALVRKDFIDTFINKLGGLAADVPAALWYQVISQLISRSGRPIIGPLFCAPLVAYLLLRFPRQTNWHVQALLHSQRAAIQAVGESIVGMARGHLRAPLSKRNVAKSAPSMLPLLDRKLSREMGDGGARVDLTSLQTIFKGMIKLACDTTPSGDAEEKSLFVTMYRDLWDQLEQVKMMSDENRFVVPVQSQLSFLVEAIEPPKSLLNQVLRRSPESWLTKNVIESLFRVPSPILSPLQLPTLPVPDVSPFSEASTVLFAGCEPRISVIKTKQKPKRLWMLGNDGNTYALLAKNELKGDLRKDSRLQEFLVTFNGWQTEQCDRVTTFNVLPLCEVAGLIEWLPTLTSVRHVVNHEWGSLVTPEACDRAVRELQKSCKTPLSHQEAIKIFLQYGLGVFPPVLHRWFFDRFGARPSHWLSSRRCFTSSNATWSAVGYFLGLGDRHCENILLDKSTGEVVHVDFDCLFGKGFLLHIPEIVPFRMTQNFVSAMGVLPMHKKSLLRRHLVKSWMRLRDREQDCLTLMSSFIHDPLVEWKSEKHRNRSSHRGPAPSVQAVRDMRSKLRGFLNVSSPFSDTLQFIRTQLPAEADQIKTEVVLQQMRPLCRRPPQWCEQSFPVETQMEMLLSAATCPLNLSLMYPGWMPWL